ncbi:MAG: DEAD/DEAH box helicase [Micrococcaceae bacterium]
MPTYPRVRPGAVETCFGPTMTARGQEYWQDDRIRTVHWDESTQKLTGSVFGNGGNLYRTTVVLLRSGPEEWEPDRSGCTCPVGDDCKHGAALVFRADELARERAEDPFAVLRTLEEQSELIQRASSLGSGQNQHSGQAGNTAPEPPSWRRTLGALVPAGGTNSEYTARQPVFDQLALGLDVHVALSERHRLYGGIQWTSLAHEYLGSTARWTVQVRPLKRSVRGNWVKTGLTWQTFSRQRPPHTLHPDPVQYELLHRLQHLYHATVSSPARSEWLNLATLDHPEAWRLLAALQEAGAPLVGLGLIGEITLTDPTELVLDVRRAPDTATDTATDSEALTLNLRPRAAGPAEEHAPTLLDDARPVGSRAVVIARSHPNGSTGKESILVQLSPLETRVPSELRGLLAGGEPLQIPAEEAPEFFDDFYPGLLTSLDVVSSDDTVEFPEIPPPELRLSASYRTGDPDDEWSQDALELSWSWHYRGFDDVTAHQRTVLSAVREIWPGAFSQPEQTLVGPAAARFSEHALDQLRNLEHVRVSIIGTRPDYRELTGAPDIGITAVASGVSHDWFDLGFQIRLDGRSVPFSHIFKALVKGDGEVLLPDKTYLSLDHPGFDRLRDLIAEAGELEEWDPSQQGVHRSNTVMLHDLEELADEWTPDEMVEEWMATITRLATLDPADGPGPAPVPDTLDATLRPYQLQGFQWLATLHDLGLGGILADDMGLGKTLQALALIAHARSHAGEGSTQPFLVVAPSSVVSVWAQEAARFTPDLRVVTLSATAAKRKKSAEDIDAELAEADLVLTSYAIARLDEKLLSARDWSGLVLDEAQFVKNRTTRTFRAVKALAERARFRLAITGTPMENTLGDLWSLAALTAPGLFPQFRLFREHFINPIEAGQRLATDPSLDPDDDPEGARTAQRAESRLEHLRDRLRPFMLRRTKEDVAPDLPEKQEQTVLVPLQPAHRRLYDTVLQRERAKVMRLLNEKDLDTHRMIVFRSLTLLRMLALDPQIVDKEHEAPSSKLEDLMQRLTEILEAEEHHQVIVFSQFTSFLKRVSKRLDDADISYAYLDGATRNRAAAVKNFREGGASVFLISLKAGGFGLTLTEADYVFLLDPWWNPAVENQAVDRAHRIGQTKNVLVYRMVAEGTIEEKVLELQHRKAALFDAVTEGTPGAAVSSGFSAEDFRALFSAPRSLEE